MSRNKWVRVIAALFAATALVLAIAAERKVFHAALQLSKKTAELEALTQRFRMRSEMLSARIADAEKELEAFGSQPVSLARDADELKAAIEQCALSCGVSCSVSSAPTARPGWLTLAVAFRTSPAKVVVILRETLRRREFFLPQRLEWHLLEPGLAAVEIEFAAALEPEGAGSTLTDEQKEGKIE